MTQFNLLASDCLLNLHSTAARPRQTGNWLNNGADCLLQAYLKDSEERMVDDMTRARREGYKFGAKIVRGAYLELERRR